MAGRDNPKGVIRCRVLWAMMASTGPFGFQAMIWREKSSEMVDR